MIKIDKYYDVQCDYCAKFMSTDYELGMAPTRKEAIMWAKNLGFRTRNGKNICPECLKDKAHLRLDCK